MLRSCIDAAEHRKGEVVARVGQQEVMAFAGMPLVADAEGELEAMCRYAGRGVGAVEAVQPVAGVIAELAEGAARALMR